MSAFLAYLLLNWVPIAAAIGAVGHIFPTKTVANKLANAIVNTATPQQAVIQSIATVLTPKAPTS